MLPPVHIPVQPLCQECLAWSQDGELAVAAGEEVYLLLPQYGSPNPWTILSITISNFTFDEWPWQESASFQEMSIGEEQARATVTALAWSPLGLAKHGRSVLAVLTSNLILSLWASNSDPTDLGSWERVSVVNKILLSGSRLQQRIRSMAWAPTNPQHVDRLTPSSGKKWGIPILAVADDSNGLYFLKVSSPFASQSLVWNIEVLRREIVAVSHSPSNRPSLLNLAMNANHFIDRIEFGRWDGSIPVVYRTSGTVCRSRLSVHEDPLSREQAADMAGSGPLIVTLDAASCEDASIPRLPIITPLMKKQMAKEKVKYGLKSNIGSDVVLRTWGVASLNDLVATCVTLHPTKMIDYTAPFEGTSTIIFDTSNGDDNAKCVFPWQSSVEVDIAKTQKSILDTMVDQIPQRTLTSNSLDLRIAYTAFCAVLLSSDEKCLYRLQMLQAAMEILEVIERHTSIDLLLERQALLSVKNTHQLSDQELSKVVRQMTLARGQDESNIGYSEKDFLDICPFCSESQRAIPFDDFTNAYCQQRHHFGMFHPPE